MEIYLKKHFLILSLILSLLILSCSTYKPEQASYSNQIRIASVGDSITYGAMINNRSEDSYPAQLEVLLGSNWIVGNYGVNGATLLKKGNKPYWKTNSFKPAHDFKPHIVIIKLGTNDSKPGNWRNKDDFVSDYIALIRSFRELDSKPLIWICYPVPAYPGRWGIRDTIIKEEILPLIDEIALETGVSVIDLYRALSDKKEMFPDTVHPDADGAKLIAETIFNRIKDFQR